MNKPVFFTGNTGTGKSMIIQNYLSSNREAQNLSPIILNFSAQTSSRETFEMIDGKLEKKRKGVIGATGNSKIFIFVDDINMPKKEIYGA
jgi:dynein heavy chain